MRVEIWGSRGSLASPGSSTIRYGGNTATVLVVGEDGEYLILDAGTGIRPLGIMIPPHVARVDILITHLHMDHLQGLGFFAPIYRSKLDVHVWGPPSITMSLHTRISRYLSPPLFPVRLRDMPCRLELHDAQPYVRIGTLRVRSDLVCHPGPTVGYRITNAEGRSVAYVPDHEPALGVSTFPPAPEWTSGFELVHRADLLIHDAQYTDDEYASHVGWGHSAIGHLAALATLAQVKRLVPFHHDPGHSDDELDVLAADLAARTPSVEVLQGAEGARFDL
jgi:phosphoribosyl 1,2-cyclic phosphodiesterase